jgi:hypothetical protein
MQMGKFKNRFGGATLLLEVGICAIGLSNIWWQMLVFFPVCCGWASHLQQRGKT